MGIFRGDGSTPTAIAREKWVAPGTGGGTFLSFGYPVLNASGQAAFFAPLRDTSDGSTCGIFRGDGSTTVAIAREKWVAPGTGGGTFLSFGHPALNASGQAAFLADLTGTVGGTADNAGIFLADDQERIVAVRKGDALAGSTITWLSFLGGQDRGNRTGLNDYGQVAYGAYLADGRQGVFLFTPELHWRAASSGNWDAGANWTVGIAPAAVHTVTIDPTSNLTVTGPILASTIKTLTVGAKTYGQTATLNLTSATGALTVAGAAAVQTAGCINVSAGTFTAGSLTNDGTFFVDVAGAASLGSLLNTGAATVGGAVTVSGGAENDGTMTVQSGGTLTAAGGLTNLGNLNLQGATLAGGTVTNDYGASMNAKGTVSTALVNNGSLSLTGVLTVLGTATNAGTVTAGLGQNLRLPGGLMNSGLISLQGGALSGLGLVVNQAAGIIRGGGGISTQFFNYGSIEVENSRTLTVSEGFGSSGVIALGGPLAVLAGGEVTNTGAILGQGQVSADVVNSGTIQATQGTLRLAGNLTNDEGGLIEVLQDATAFVTHGLATNSGTTILRAGTFDNGRHLVTNSGTITGHGTLRTGGLTNAPGRNIGVGGGDLDVIGPVTNDGTVTTQGGCTTTFYNRVNGDGSFPGTGTVVFLDGFSPGHSPAAISFGGNVVFGSAGRFVAELGGTTPGTEYDQANVAGAATLGGTLEVSLVDGFRPAHNDTFQVMTFGSRAGTFPSATGLDRGSRLTLEPAYSSTDLALAAVQGGSGAWRFDTNGSASVPANWTGGIPNGLGDTATFGPVIQAPREVTVDAATVLTAMVFDSAKAYTVAGPGTVTLNAGGDSATISVTGASGAANHIISAPLTLLSALDIDNEATGDLAFAGGLNDLAGQTITKIGQGPVTFEGPLTFGAGSLLMVYDGTVNLNSDAGSDLAANLSIDVMDATVNFGHDQHLDWLTIGDGGKVVFTGARVVVLNHLVMDGLALGSTTLTPEPATLALVALGWAFLAGRRRRRGR